MTRKTVVLELPGMDAVTIEREVPYRTTESGALTMDIGFVNPGAGKSIDDLPRDLPLSVLRAGQDQMPHLNDSINTFVAAALASNLPLTLANHATGPHAYDLLDDNETAREMIRSILAFFRFHLVARARDGAR